jgi:hypothetical protein
MADSIFVMVSEGTRKGAPGLLRHVRTRAATDIYQQVVPKGVENMIDLIHVEFRKPRAAAAETSMIGAKLRAKNKNRPVRKKRKIDIN